MQRVRISTHFIGTLYIIALILHSISSPTPQHILQHHTHVTQALHLQSDTLVSSITHFGTA